MFDELRFKTAGIFSGRRGNGDTSYRILEYIEWRRDTYPIRQIIEPLDENGQNLGPGIPGSTAAPGAIRIVLFRNRASTGRLESPRTVTETTSLSERRLARPSDMAPVLSSEITTRYARYWASIDVRFGFKTHIGKFVCENPCSRRLM